MKQAIFCAIMAFTPVAFAHAYTECSNLNLTRVYTDVGGNFFVSTGGYLNGMIDWTANSYKTSVAIALTARAAGMPITIRYERDGVTCGSAAWNDAIIGIAM